MFLIDIEDFKRARLTIGLLLFNVVCYIAFANETGEKYILYFILNNRRVLYNFEYWRLFAAIFFHANPMHLFSNMFALLIFGTTIETNKGFSKVKYIVLYIFSGVLGNLFTLILLPVDSYSLGASGAIFGLIGACVIMLIAEDPSLLIFALIYVAYFLLSSLQPGVNYWAHIFGLLGGISLAYLFKLNNVRIIKH